MSACNSQPDRLPNWIFNKSCRFDSSGENEAVGATAFSYSLAFVGILFINYELEITDTVTNLALKINFIIKITKKNRD